ncbi:MAG: hypothetical protein LBB76_04965 [Azoarcus sp.]|nr:hypothetical protein [Azoarcus sp.]
MKSHSVQPQLLRLRSLTAALALAFASDGALALDIATVPLIVGGNVPANLLYIHDDSSSMAWGYMPDSSSLSTRRAYSSSAYNTIYYNPLIKYEPPPKSDGVTQYPPSPFTAAYIDGYAGSGKINLQTEFRPVTASNTVYVGTKQAAFYHRFTGGGCQLTNLVDQNSSTCFKKILVGSTGVEKNYDDWDRPEYNHPDNDTPEKRRQNFANWYSYYKIRNFAARAGIGRAFVQLDPNIRVGWMRVNSYTTIKGVSTYDSAVRTEFLNWLYNTPPVGGTYLAAALNAAGKYYDKSGAAADYGPWADDPTANKGKGAGKTMASCRKSYAILMTDGMYSDIAAVGNADGPATASFTTPPKADGSTASMSKAPFGDNRLYTLADVAWTYWAKDLSSAENKVGTNTRDPAWWQHMTTYTIGLGVAPETTNKRRAFYAADHNQSPNDSSVSATVAGPAFTWPSTLKQIDDLLHAGVNGHGDFFSASDPDEFVESMQKIVASIADSAAGSSNIATNKAVPGAAGSSDALSFKLTFKTDKWSGELTANELNAIDSTNKDAVGNVVWNASERMPAPDARNIFTRKNPVGDVASTGIGFKWNSLADWQQDILQEGDKGAHGQEILDYLRGNKSKETAFGGPYRNRARANNSSGTLGDSPNNTPIYDKDTDTVYLGANDGMLHAFDGKTGVERFAYIPSAVFAKLPKLAHMDYGHEYYVDGDVTIVKIPDADERYLVGTLGRGGKGLYGLKVDSPDNFSANDVKWEFNGHAQIKECDEKGSANLNSLGIIIDKPVIAMHQSGRHVAIVGNGYNSCGGKVALYMIDVRNGAVVERIDAPDSYAGDNGLSAPYYFDGDRDGVISAGDAIYAGDLKGNLWKFEPQGRGWKIALGQPMFTAHDGDGKIQPITARPMAMTDSATNKTFVFFGTGQFLQSRDKTDQSIQSWYGLIDGGSTISRENLKERKLSLSDKTGTLTDGTSVALRTIEKAAEGDMDDMEGWVIDFDLATDRGERIVSPTVAFSMGSHKHVDKMVLQTSSIIPSDDPCGSNGRGWINRINPFTGAALAFPVTDITGDGKVDANDTDDKVFPASVGVSDGMPGPPNEEIDPCVNSIDIVGSTGGGISSSKLNAHYCSVPGVKGRLSWRELAQ